MRSILSSSLVLLIALVLGACSGTTDTTPAETASGVSTPSKGASVQSNDVTITKKPYNSRVRSTCTGGFIQIRGTRHISQHRKLKSDGTMEYRYTLNVQGNGEDASGRKYVLKSNNLEFTRAVGEEGCPFTLKESDSRVLIAQGAGNDEVYTYEFEVTTYCDGTFDVVINNEETTCK